VTAAEDDAMSVKHRITWRRQSNETGLRSVGAVERGYDLRVNGDAVASVRPVTGGTVMDRATRGWYWSAPTNAALGIEWRNTFTRTAPNFATVEEAKADAEKYVRGCLAATTGG
jgi:hypothetical protein